MMKSKDELRKIAKEIRKSLNIEQISKKIMLNLKNTQEYKDAAKILCYSSIGTEVDTSYVLNDNSKCIYLPRVAGNLLEICKYIPTQLVVSSYGINEPCNECISSISEIELIIMPGLAFTFSGNRLGYGKGFYDRFIAQNPTTATKIGLVPDGLLLDSIPCDKHDQKCDIIITETRVINTKFN